MSEYTPGPWDYDKFCLTIDAGLVSVGGVLSDLGDIDITDANGRLMAAAPELLEALESALVALVVNGCGWMTAATEAREAIAKAKGQAVPS